MKKITKRKLKEGLLAIFVGSALLATGFIICISVGMVFSRSFLAIPIGMVTGAIFFPTGTALLFQGFSLILKAL